MPDPGDRLARLQSAAASLLRFAIENRRLSVPTETVEAVTPLLRLSPSEITPENEAVLTVACDGLTKVVSPCTLESAILANELADWASRPGGWAKRALAYPAAAAAKRRTFWWVLLTVVLLILFLGLQGIAIGLGTALEDAKSLGKSIDSAATELLLLQGAGKDPANAGPAQEAERKLLNLVAKFEAAQSVMRAFGAPGTAPEAKSKSGPGMSSERQYTRLLAGLAETEVYARVLLEMIMGYAIPLCLGLLGASADVTRRMSSTLRDNTYVSGRAMQDRVRLVQGATFGTLAGILAGALQTEASAANVSIPALALVFGYNSEMVFRAMDVVSMKFKSYLASPPKEGKEDQSSSVER
jgi:hypothetical protein